MTIRSGSVCSGAGTGELAFGPFGVEPAWVAEIEPAPCSVLAHHWPDVPNLGDMRLLAPHPGDLIDGEHGPFLEGSIRSGEVESPDILMGGTPCQAFSVAGLRESLNDARGNLTLTFVEIANAIDAVRRARGLPPAVVFWENVPGVLSTDDNAFGCFLGSLVGAGAPIPTPDGGWPHAGVVAGPTRRLAWRVLDAQYFGLAQRRERVFVVAGAGAFRPESVLFEPASLRRDPPTRGEAREGSTYETAPCLRSSGVGVERIGDTRGADCVVAVEEPQTFDWQAGGGGADDSFRGKSRSYIADKPGRCRALGANKVPAVFGGNNQGGAIDVAPALNAKGGSGRMDFESEALCVTDAPIMVCNGSDPISSIDISQPITTRHGDPGTIAHLGAVRRLMPVECEKLQGLRPNHTLVPHGKKGEPMADGPRYKIIGNGWALNVVRWIAGRIVSEMRRTA